MQVVANLKEAFLWAKHVIARGKEDDSAAVERLKNVLKPISQSLSAHLSRVLDLQRLLVASFAKLSQSRLNALKLRFQTLIASLALSGTKKPGMNCCPSKIMAHHTFLETSPNSLTTRFAGL